MLHYNKYDDYWYWVRLFDQARNALHLFEHNITKEFRSQDHFVSFLRWPHYPPREHLSSHRTSRAQSLNNNSTILVANKIIVSFCINLNLIMKKFAIGRSTTIRQQPNAAITTSRRHTCIGFPFAFIEWSYTGCSIAFTYFDTLVTLLWRTTSYCRGAVRVGIACGRIIDFGLIIDFGNTSGVTDTTFRGCTNAARNRGYCTY